jgi:hypothetical protein
MYFHGGKTEKDLGKESYTFVFIHTMCSVQYWLPVGWSWSCFPKGRTLLLWVSTHGLENEKFTKKFGNSTNPVIQSQSKLQPALKCWGHFDTPSNNEKAIPLHHILLVCPWLNYKPICATVSSRITQENNSTLMN